MAMSRETLVVLLLQAWLIFIPVILTPANGLHYHQRAGQKPAIDNNPGFISIDCGATEDYYDESTGIFYKTDAEFIDTGRNVKLPAISDKLPKQVYNLRSFPDGAKNCYTLKPEQGKNNKYLVRASFRYGNYDGKNKAPVFDLYLGVNLWDTVEVQDSDNVNYTWSEIIHVPTTDNIYVCLVNKDSGTPCISTLELRLLDSSIYPIESGALATSYTLRYDVGGTSVVRYGDDVYDRIWDPLPFSGPSDPWLPLYLNTTISNQGSNGTYFPPEEVLRTAAQGQNASKCLVYSWDTDHASTEYYVYLYFTEIEDLKDGQPRRLDISLNDVNPLTYPIELEYLKPLTIDFPKFPIKGDGAKFSICTTMDSKLPPVLNAFEIFKLIPLPESPTEPEDVNAVMDIKQVYGIMSRNWQGDPCVPSNFSWDGLHCSYNNIARIISLNLSSSKLKGEIAQSLSNLKAIQNMDLSNNYLTGPLPEFLVQLPSLIVLDLSNNDLTGPVPDFVANFPSLRTLNLSGNKLRGSIPQAVMKAMDDGLLNLSMDRNPDLCLSAPCKPKENNFIIPVIASITSFLVLVLIALALWWKCRRQGVSIGSRRSSMSKNKEFTYSEVVSITDNFRTVIGEGGFGKVYLGTLKNGDQVAVKLRSSSSKQGLKEFRTEALLLMRVHHGNLVSLIGFCDDGKNMVLVYEYMANGDLRQHLSEKSSNVLNWSERLQVARDAAQGLEYLHNGCKPPIIHRDVKTANILLNRDYQGKIADFGLSRDSVEADTHTTNPAGTFAYMDPEYISSRKLNKKSDVYSFGIVLLELITGQPALIRSPDMIHIVHWIRPFIERGDIRSIVDPRLQGEFNPDSAWKAVEIAMSCIPPAAIQRPEMSDVLSELKECLAIEMARHRSWSRKSNERSLSNSLELATMNLDTDITPSAR